MKVINKMIKDVIDVWKLVLKDIFSIDFILFFSALYFVMHIAIAISKDYF